MAGLLFPFLLIVFATLYAFKTRKCPGRPTIAMCWSSLLHPCLQMDSTRQDSSSSPTASTRSTGWPWCPSTWPARSTRSGPSSLPTPSPFLVKNKLLHQCHRHNHCQLLCLFCPLFIGCNNFGISVGIVQLSCLVLPKLHTALFKPEKNTAREVNIRNLEVRYMFLYLKRAFVGSIVGVPWI